MTVLLAESAPPDLRWTIAGRSRPKLEALAQAGSEREVLVADCADDEALLVLAARTRVLISAAGPFSMLGERVMLACIEAKTHYVDITGEVPWVAEMRRLHGARARAAGVCIASFCGYDCVPCELGVYLGRQALGTGLTLTLTLNPSPKPDPNPSPNPSPSPNPDPNPNPNPNPNPGRPLARRCPSPRACWSCRPARKAAHRAARC